MKVILNQDVYNLGEEGDVCEVANGYARNYLIPQGLASLYNAQNIAIFKSRKAAIEKRKEEKRKASLSLKEQIENTEVVLQVPSGENGKLFGSVTNAHVAEELKVLGITLERKKIELPEHSLKMLGVYTAKIKLYGNESADLKIIVKSDKDKEDKEAEKNPEKAENKTETVEKQPEEAAEVSSEEPVETSADESAGEEPEVLPENEE